MFKNLLSTLFSFATSGSSISTYLMIGAGAFAIGAYSGYALTSDHYEAKLAKVNVEATQHFESVVNQQAKISQQTQEDKDELQTRYDGVVAMLRGVHNPGVQANGNPTLIVPSQGLRLLEPDAEVLIGFAKQCADTEIERNDVINKYNALMVK